jgi:hypothetical protein
MKVFISSTFRDLVEQRKRLGEELRHAGEGPVQMEFFSARPEQPLEVCLQEVRESDLFLLLVGERYGTIDERTGLSFTELEYREARSLGIPVLAFLLETESEGGPASHAEEPARKLAAFRALVLQEQTPVTHVPPDAIPARVLGSLLRFVKEHGDGGGRFRFFQEPEVFFSRHLRPRAIFNHLHPLIGRDSELGDILGFLQGSESIAVLPGPGGSGKSRLLLEASRRWKDVGGGRPIRVAADAATFSQEDVRGLPVVPVIVIIDDAHRRGDLAGLLAAVANDNAGAKFILSVRPEGRGQVRDALRGAPGVMWLSDLEPLERETHAEQLAMHVLETSDQRFARRLVAASDGNPLIITVGGRLVRESKIAPELLDRSEDFVSEALNGLVSSIPDPLAENVARSRLLGVLAGIGPVAIGAGDLRSRLASLLEAEESAVAVACDTLEEQGVLFRRGRLVRITPDILSDHVLFSAAVTRRGESTGFIDELVRGFGGSHLRNILRNAAELEWRSRAAGTDVRVLDTTWRAILDGLPGMSHFERHVLLGQLETVAILSPSPVLEVVEWIVQHEEAPEEGAAVLGGQSPRSWCLRELPALLGAIAQHQNHSWRAAELLVSLAADDHRETNPFPGHPVRKLEDLVGYRVYQPIETQLATIEVLRTAARRGDLAESPWSPAHIVRGALSREVDSSWAERRVFHISAYAIDPKQVQPVRQAALEFLRETAMSGRSKDSASAVEVIGEVLQAPWGSFGRQVSDQERKGWVQEACDAADILAQVAKESDSPVARYLAWRALYTHHSKWSDRLSSHIKRLRVPFAEAGVDIFACLSDPLERSIGGFEQRNKKHEVFVGEVAGRLWDKSGEIQLLLDTLEEHTVALSASSTRIYRGPHLLVAKLVEMRPGTASEMIRGLSTRGGRLLREGLPAAMLGGIRAGNREDVLNAARQAIADGGDDARRSVAYGVGYFLDGGSAEEEIELIKDLIADSDHEVRRAGLRCVEGLSFKDKAKAKELLVAVVNSGANVDTLFRCLGNHRIPVAELTSEEVTNLLDALARTQSIDEYWAREFLKEVAGREPRKVVETLLQRIHFATQLTDESGEFRPLPLVGERLDLSALRATAELSDLLRLVRDECRKDRRGSYVCLTWLPRLYCAVAGETEAGIDVLREWLQAGERDKVVGAITLARGFEREFVFKHADFVAESLEMATSIGGDTRKSVRSSIAALANSGSACGDIAAHYDGLRERATRLASQYEQRREVSEFFRDLAVGFGHQATRWREWEDEEEI